MQSYAIPRHGPTPSILIGQNPMGGILRTESRHLPTEAYLVLPNYAVGFPQPSDKTSATLDVVEVLSRVQKDSVR